MNPADIDPWLPVDLDELETLVRAGIFLPWRYEIPQKNVRIRASNGDFVMESGPYYVRREQEAQLIVAAVNALPALIAELRAARQDAARWQYVQDLIPYTIHEQCGFPMIHPLEHITRARLNLAIDAAIAKGGTT